MGASLLLADVAIVFKNRIALNKLDLPAPLAPYNRPVRNARSSELGIATVCPSCVAESLLLATKENVCSLLNERKLETENDTNMNYRDNITPNDAKLVSLPA